MYWLISAALAQSPSWSSLPVCLPDIAACEDVYTTQPKPTRNPAILRFTDPSLSDPKWTPLHVERLLDVNTPENVQLALIALLQRSDIQSIESRLLPLFEAESPELRVGMAELIPKLSNDSQKQAISVLTKDSDWLVRSQMMRVVARHLGQDHPRTLIDGLEDDHTDVRLHSIKGLGWNDVSVPLQQLSPHLEDADSRVRLHTLRTIERLYPGSVVKLGLLETLIDDPDPKVQREIIRIQTAH